VRTPALLEVRQLSVRYAGAAGATPVVHEADLEVAAGECLGIAGESGSGKTQLLWAILGLSGARAAISGSVRYRGEQLLGLGPRALNRVRGRSIGLVFQDPMSALNPYLRVGQQITEVLSVHRGIHGRDAARRAIELLESLHLPDPAQRLQRYPHELSGGMRQRVAIAMAMIAQPDILLADEPTTALDVTVQAQILELFSELRARGTAIVLVTHDLGVIAQVADRVAVMYRGRIVEQAPTQTLFARPQHSYSEGLLRATARLDQPLAAQMAALGRAATQTATCDSNADIRSAPLLAVQRLDVAYPVHDRGRSHLLPAVNGVSFEVRAGESLGIVGESGSGKTSVARALLRLVDARGGQAWFQGEDLLQLTGARLRALRRQLQLIFQDPLASLDPRLQIADIIAEPLRAFEPGLTARQRHQRVLQALTAVGLAPEHADRFPHEFSGGQAQRIAIARGLVAEPKLIVCDEPLSSLDVSIKSQISNLLMDLQQQRGVTLLFISHDLPAVRLLCARVMVLYLGRVMEMAPRDACFGSPRHPYTRALLRAVPLPDPVAARARPAMNLIGEIPSPLDVPSGCVFRTRCPFAIERCRQEVPPLRSVGASMVACHRAEELDTGACLETATN
jgi:oligopeptide/dipeptide ABC transporter ATP-binding protein